MIGTIEIIVLTEIIGTITTTDTIEMIAMTGIPEAIAITEVVTINITAISKDGFSKSVGHNIISKIDGGKTNITIIKDGLKEKDAERICAGSKDI